MERGNGLGGGGRAERPIPEIITNGGKNYDGGAERVRGKKPPALLPRGHFQRASPPTRGPSIDFWAYR